MYSKNKNVHQMFLNGHLQIIFKQITRKKKQFQELEQFLKFFHNSAEVKEKP